MCDLQFNNRGFAVSCAPLTAAGRNWLADNLADDTLDCAGAVMIEHRYLEDIVLGARADGLVCEG